MIKSKASEDWLEHKTLWESSGLSQRQYCKDANLCARKFNYHLKRINKEVGVKPGFKFLGLSSIEENKPSKEEEGRLKIEFPNGVRLVLEFSSNKVLTQMIEVVGGLPC